LSFEFATAESVMFGEGIVEQLPDIVRRCGQRPLVVLGADLDRFSELVRRIELTTLQVARFRVCREPTVEDVEQAVVSARDHRADVVVGIGGGSVLDAAKALAALVTNRREVSEYLEVVGNGSTLEVPGLPCIAVPTTSGTGAEVTRNAVIDVPSHGVKVSLRGQFVLPRVALVDPALSMSVPPATTAATGFDALAQVVEPYVSNRANPMTDALAEAAFARVRTALSRAYHHPSDRQARCDMALVSLWGGMCLANAKLGAVHGLAGPIGGMLHVPHGALCAALLGPVMRQNVTLAGRRGDCRDTLRRYERMARILTDDSAATAAEGVSWIENLAEELGIRRLQELGVQERAFADIAARAARASSMQGNPLRLGVGEIIAILERAL